MADCNTHVCVGALIQKLLTFKVVKKKKQKTMIRRVEYYYWWHGKKWVGNI